MKKISIIIPHFNSWSMLKQLLNTIPKCSYIEIIVVDDHTPDNFKMIPEIQKEFPNVQLILNDKDKKGAGAARNKGLSIASGKWLLFADADDIFLPEFYNVVNSFIDTTYDIIYFIPTSFIHNSNEYSPRHEIFEEFIYQYINSPSTINEINLRFNFSPPWSKMIKRNLIIDNQIKFDETKVANDVMFSAKAGNAANDIIATEQKIYAVRQTIGSITSVISDENFRIRFNVWVELINYMRMNIEKRNFKKMNVSILPHILQVFEKKLSYSNIYYILKKAYIHKIPFIDKRIFNVKFIDKTLRKRKKYNNKLKKTEINK